MKRKPEEEAGLRKCKQPVSQLSTYSIDKEHFIEHFISLEPGSEVNWRDLSRCYRLRNRRGDSTRNAR